MPAQRAQQISALFCLNAHWPLWANSDAGTWRTCSVLDICQLILLLFSLFPGMEGIECSLPLDGRRIPLSLLSEDSFRECRGTLTLTDYLIVIFSGISVSVAAIMASFFLASTVHCFQRLSKGSKGDEEEGNDWQEGDVGEIYYMKCKCFMLSCCWGPVGILEHSWWNTRARGHRWWAGW